MFFFVYFYGGLVGVYFVGFVYGYVNGQLVGVRNKYLDDNRINYSVQIDYINLIEK